MVRVGIIGLGDGGLSNLRSLKSVPKVRVVALCDVDAGKFKKAEDELEYLAANYISYNDLLTNDVDLVVVATPDAEHLEPTRAALKAGKRVFLEKPAATSIDDLLELAKLAEQYPSKILFSEKYSFARPIQAALQQRENLGEFLWGNTLYTMWRCDRIMGGGKWRTESKYNPCAGGLSHNFMTALLFSKSPIVSVSATGQVQTYHENLDSHGGFDFMTGMLRFESGRVLNWTVCLAVRGDGSPFAHRTVTHTLQFENGSLHYNTQPGGDCLKVGGEVVGFDPEPNSPDQWGYYNINQLYRGMHVDNLLFGKQPLHNIRNGINVAAACALAFESAHRGGEWIDLPPELRR